MNRYGRQVFVNAHLPAPARLQQSPRDIARIDRRVFRIEESFFSVGGCRDYAEFSLLLRAGLQVDPLFFGDRDIESAITLVIDDAVRFPLEVGDELRIEPSAMHGEIGPLGALCDLAARRQHSSAGPTGFTAGLARVDHDDATSTLRQSPRDGQANDPRSNDDGVRTPGRHYSPRRTAVTLSVADGSGREPSTTALPPSRIG